MPPKVFLYQAGQIVFREHAPSDRLFIVKKGVISIRKIEGDSFIEIGNVKSMGVFGELAFFDRLARSATAVATTDAELLEITYESLDEIYNAIPDYMKTIAAAMADRLRKANDQIVRLQKRIK